MLTTDAVAEIKACAGIYRAADVARHYDVHRSTVTRIWQGQAHRDLSPAADFPDIHTRARAEDLHEDIATRLGRGESVQDIADAMDVSAMTVYRVRMALGGVWV